MEQQAELERTLRAILGHLEPYRSDLVLIGGWVPYLYRHYGGFGALSGADTLTLEMDLLVSRALPPDGRPTLRQVLHDAEFRPMHEEHAPAVWGRDLEAGERIEFLTLHRGMARSQGRVVPLAGQAGVGAISLAELEVVRDYTQPLILPPAHGFGPVEVRVPTLGAYVVNKALTFIRRRAGEDGGGSPKLAKDLLYLRELASAGDDLVAAIARDVDAIAASDAQGAERVRTAATNLQFVVDGHLGHHLAAVAEMVVEREPVLKLAIEEARTRALLLDLHEILLDVAQRHAPLEDIEADPD